MVGGDGRVGTFLPPWPVGHILSSDDVLSSISSVTCDGERGGAGEGRARRRPRANPRRANALKRRAWGEARAGGASRAPSPAASCSALASRGREGARIQRRRTRQSTPAPAPHLPSVRARCGAMDANGDQGGAAVEGAAARRVPPRTWSPPSTKRGVSPPLEAAVRARRPDLGHRTMPREGTPALGEGPSRRALGSRPRETSAGTPHERRTAHQGPARN